MSLQYTIKDHTLEFIRDAKTSRNTFKERKIHLVELLDPVTGSKGIGEAAPLQLLSVDDVPDYKDHLEALTGQLCEGTPYNELELENFPSIAFGLETALLDLHNSNGRLFSTPFTQGEASIPINGLVWMSDLEEMEKEAFRKVEEGYNCIKFKVGAQDFDGECRMLESIRKQHSAFNLEIRLDANGAFDPSEAPEQLKELRRFEVHSIEQPIGPRLWDDMARLCHNPLIPIALDEELIGLKPAQYAEKMLKTVRPQYLILKPNLIGGLAASDLWIEFAQKMGIKWWATSALESNVGLNAIAQWVSQYDNSLHQGLGTGKLYCNNLPSLLVLKSGRMYFKTSVSE